MIFPRYIRAHIKLNLHFQSDLTSYRTESLYNTRSTYSGGVYLNMSSSVRNDYHQMLILSVTALQPVSSHTCRIQCTYRGSKKLVFYGAGGLPFQDESWL